MTDMTIVDAAIAAAGGRRRLAWDVLDVDESTVGNWRNGTRRLDPTVRVVCAAIVADPAVADLLSAALDDLRARGLTTPSRRSARGSPS